LLGGAVGNDRKGSGARVDGDRDADTGIAAGKLLEHEDVGEKVGARSSELLRDADAQETQPGKLREQLAREAMLPVPVSGVGLDLRRGEVPR
jgi:hypothetical protein